MNINKLFALPLIAITLAFGGCASVPMADSNADNDAKKIEVPSGKAVVYVISYGGSAPFGSAWVNQVSVNRENRGALAYKTYQVYTVAPGPVIVMASPGPIQAVAKLTAVTGKAYFVQVKSLVFGRVGAEQIDEVTARKIMQECSLAEGL